MNKLQALLYIILSTWSLTEARNPRRPKNHSTPCISVTPSNQELCNSWMTKHCKKRLPKSFECKLTNQFLRIKPLKQGFDKKYFAKKLIPKNTNISYKNNKGSVNSQELSQLAEKVLQEVKDGKQTFTDFTILKCKDFNFKNLSGLLVLKYKKYPFVLKLSIEHPHTMVKPYTKSFEANCIFMIGGNFRHLSNFTRIPNLENLKKILSYNPYYLEKIDFPRKWYWQPKNNYNLEITWHKSDYRPEEKIIIPSTYATLSDFIEVDDSQSQRELNKVALKISRDTGFLVDPHAGNLVINKDTGKHTMIDTENFRLILGVDHSLNAQTYIGWFAEMITTSIKKYCGRTKKERIEQSFYM